MTESSGCKYRAFISYSHRDKAWADWLHKALETYRVPPRLVGTKTDAGVVPGRIIPVFRDREELASATDLGRKVNEALGQSENLIVLCSPASAVSHWVNEEVLAYKRMGRGEHIFCLIVDGEPNATGVPGHEDEECFSPALRFKCGADGGLTDESAEPIAADARPGKDGKSNARLKLIAGMLGVGFDALKQREQHRRVQRMAIVTALALVVMALTSVLAVYALIARNAAVRAKHAAVIAQQAAERRQKQAEGLIDFMLGDLSTRLRKVDRLDILSAVDDKAMAYFKSLPSTDVTDTALAERAKTLQKIGDVRMDRGRLPDAMDAFQQALQLHKQLVDAKPNDAMRQNAYGENLLWIGFADWSAGKLDRAETAFKQSAAALARAASLDTSSKEIAQNLDYVYNNLGKVAQARGELDVAASTFAKDEALIQRMLASHPHDADWQQALADAHDNIATLALMRGRLEVAINGYLHEQRVLQSIATQQPRNMPVQASLVKSDAILGRTLALAGHTQEGIVWVNAGLRLGEVNLKFDPSHDGWWQAYAYYSALLGRLKLAQGNSEAAAKPIDSAIATFERLVKKDPSDMELRANLAEVQVDGARLAMARKQPREADRLAKAALENLQKPMHDSPGSIHTSPVAAAAALVLARLAEHAGNAGAAAQYRHDALSRMRAITTHSEDPRKLALLVEALLVSGKSGDARPYITQLQAMGYRPDAFVDLLREHGIDYPANRQFDARVAKLLQTSPPDHGAAHAGK